MATSIRTNIKTIMDALKAKLVLDEVGTDSTIYLGDTDEGDLPQGGGFIVVLRPRNELPVRGVQAAAGRYDRRVRRRLAVDIYTNLNLDETGQAIAWFTDVALGHFQAEDAVIDSLDTFQPEDSDGNVLTYEPLLYNDLSETRKLQQGWGRSTVMFEVPYIRALDQSEQ